MSSTRRATDDSEFHQERYASSADYERGLKANLVAQRCTALDVPADRELVWFLHHLSHQPGSLTALRSELVKNYGHRFGTPTMVRHAGEKVFDADTVGAIREEMEGVVSWQFVLNTDDRFFIEKFKQAHLNQFERQSFQLSSKAERARELSTFRDDPLSFEEREKLRQKKADEREKLEAAELEKYPSSYPAERFQNVCMEKAAGELQHAGNTTINALEYTLQRLCLDPGFDLVASAPWYCSALMDILREYHQQWIKKKSEVVVTSLGAVVFENLAYAQESRSCVLMEGNARLGKSFAAKAWCEIHPGKARFVEVPPGNDDAGFFRALAIGLGIGNFLNYKVGEIRARVESVLRAGDLLLVLDEAHRLWPQRNLRYGHPHRIDWLMTQANAGVPICCISTPQFIHAQKAMEKAGWNSAQLTGRIGHYVFLPTELTNEDLQAVGRAAMPTASDRVLKALAIYARTSDRYLAAVEALAKRAQFIARKNGRTEATESDVVAAMKEVIPSDTRLNRTLNQARLAGRPAPHMPAQSQQQIAREVSPVPNAPAGRRATTPATIQTLEV